MEELLTQIEDFCELYKNHTFPIDDLNTKFFNILNDIVARDQPVPEPTTIDQWTVLLNDIFDILHQEYKDPIPLDALLLRVIYENTKTDPLKIKELSGYIRKLGIPIIALNMCEHPMLDYLHLKELDYTQIINDLIPGPRGLLVLTKCNIQHIAIHDKPLYINIFKQAFKIEDLVDADQSFYSAVRLSYMDYFPLGIDELTRNMELFTTHEEKLMYLISAIHFSEKFQLQFEDRPPNYGDPVLFIKMNRLNSAPRTIETCYHYLKLNEPSIYDKLVLASSLDINELKLKLDLCIYSTQHTYDLTNITLPEIL